MNKFIRTYKIILIEGFLYREEFSVQICNHVQNKSLYYKRLTRGPSTPSKGPRILPLYVVVVFTRHG